MIEEIKLRRLESIYSDEKYAKGKMLDNIIEVLFGFK